MAKTSAARSKPDPLAIASKGRVTSQIKTQESNDKPIILSTLEEN